MRCPNCETISDAASAWSSGENGDPGWLCPECGFFVPDGEVDAVVSDYEDALSHIERSALDGLIRTAAALVGDDDVVDLLEAALAPATGMQRITLVLLDADVELLRDEMAEMNQWAEEYEAERGTPIRRWVNVEEVAAVVLGLELQQRARARKCKEVLP